MAKQIKNIKPYARLLTMLGEQLIKDESIALVELIKNSYDADAEKVNVRFENFLILEENGTRTLKQKENESKIILEDSGIGMSSTVIEDHWLNPATPIKKEYKANNQKTEKGRVIQGEKGIGRFSLFKLGSKITVITKPKDSSEEYVVEYDFSKFDEDFYDKGLKKHLFLEDIKVTFEPRSPVEIVNSSYKKSHIWAKNQGTKIIIENIKGNWSEKKISDIVDDIRKMRPLFEIIKTEDVYNDFAVDFYIDEELFGAPDKKYLDNLKILLDNKPVIKVTDGLFDETNKNFIYKLDGIDKTLSLDDDKIKGNIVFKNFINSRCTLFPFACGSFHFEFYIFDLSPTAPTKFYLDRDEKEIIRENRIYLYRDKIRVYPYGESTDDWLGVDKFRGTVSAGGLFSNDQIIGCVYITQKDNPNLTDKTSREGLIGNGSFEDLIGLLKVFLSYLRGDQFAKYKKKNEQKNEIKNLKVNVVSQHLQEAQGLVEDNKKAGDLLEKTKKIYENERRQFIDRIDTAETLAGVGLSVETASHDIMLFMNKTMERVDNLIYRSNSDLLTIKELGDELVNLRGSFSFIQDKLQNIQLLFKSSNRKRKNTRIKDVLEKIITLFTSTLDAAKIQYNIVSDPKYPLVVKISDAILMQVFINLLDNAIYWLATTSKKEKKISIILDGKENYMIFADNGPGIHEDDRTYIFEAFYSGKGDEGRGLGLYIARQLLEKNDFEIRLVDDKNKILPGANFIIDFNLKDSE